MGEFLVSVELKHDSLDEIKHYNNILVMLDGFMFSLSPHIGKNTLYSLSTKNCKLPFRVIFQHFVSVKLLFLHPGFPFGP